MLDKRTKDVRRDLSTSTNHVVDQAALTPDPAHTAIIDKWQPLFDAAGSTPIGTITADINRGGVPDRIGSWRRVARPATSSPTPSCGRRRQLVADVAFMNPGGVRSDLTYLESQTH